MGWWDTLGGPLGAIYKSTDYGDTWVKVVDQTNGSMAGLGVMPYMVIPFGAVFLALAYSATTNIILLKGDAIDGTYAKVLPTGVEDSPGLAGAPDLWVVGARIWCSGTHYTTATAQKAVHHSTDGQTWAVGASFVSSANQNSNNIRVNAAATKGFFIVVDSGVVRGRYTSDPAGAPGTWTPVTVSGGLGQRFGAQWPHLISPSTTSLKYSSDNGNNWSNKTIPAAAQVAGNLYRKSGADIHPTDADVFLLCPLGKGIWRSADQGASWAEVLSTVVAPTGSVWGCGVRFDPYDGDKAYAWGDNGFFKSEDAGLHWHLSSVGLP